ncbi:hypothetical protein bpmyx0001_19290 [Bacillus pseudomycoides DSM 12442]|nr:hypothetical protein bpmyx0001_19290 [Bacillus pseudomycoides DSM 12442]
MQKLSKGYFNYQDGILKINFKRNHGLELFSFQKGVWKSKERIRK